MKKILTILLAVGLIVIGTIAMASQPECAEGSHYEGEYVETTTCENVCTFRLFGYCFNWEEQCETTGEWVGSCVADEVVEEPEEPVEDPKEPTTPIASVSSGEVPLWAILANQCKEENIEYSEWSECNPLFNMQIRTAKPLNNCTLTGLQQAHLVKWCGAVGAGIDN